MQRTLHAVMPDAPGSLLTEPPLTHEAAIFFSEEADQKDGKGWFALAPDGVVYRFESEDDALVAQAGPIAAVSEPREEDDEEDEEG